ncbi:MAG: hypothetical protein PHW75_00465 [Patescibacteria group bacterium]|nr:hypothetical protein [Patescibacteria group bacterium]
MKRQKKNDLYKEIKSLRAAVKENCYDCMCGQKKVDCDNPDCPLYLFRPFGDKK